MKSARPRPVVWPLKVNCPLVGRLFTVSILVRIQLPPNGQLMPAAHDVDVVGDLEAVGIEVAGVGAAGADVEAVRHADAHVAGLRAVDRGAEVGRREVQRQRPVVDRLVEGDVEGVDHRRGQDPVVADDERVHLVVLSGPAQRQHVLAVVGAGIVVDRVQVAAEQALARATSCSRRGRASGARCCCSGCRTGGGRRDRSRPARAPGTSSRSG